MNKLLLALLLTSTMAQAEYNTVTTEPVQVNPVVISTESEPIKVIEYDEKKSVFVKPLHCEMIGKRVQYCK